MEITHKPQTRKEIANALGISICTLYKWLQPLKDQLRPNAKILTPGEVKIIYNHLDIDA